MKKLFAVLAIALIASCSLPVATLAPGEVLIDGLWSGWQIIAGGMVFDTPIGIKTINHPVQIVQHDGQWYIWDNGYGLKITPR